MNEITRVKVLVVGGGPGGYAAAIRCGQLGLDTLLIEQGRLGGTCLTRGCIPSKAIIHAATQFEEMNRVAEAPRFGISLANPPRLDFAATIDWKDGIVDQLNKGVAGLLTRAGVKVVRGHARFRDAKTCRVTSPDGDITVHAEHVILATGSVPVELPALPFGGPVMSSSEALSLTHLPTRMAVVGAGYIGLELGIAFRKLGVDVSVVEASDQILPHYDAQLVEPVVRWLERHGVTLHLGARALGFDASELAVETQSGQPLSLPADMVLVTAGRKPAVSGWDLETMALSRSSDFIRVDDRCATSTTNVWAIGDLVGEPMLAHKATAQGTMVAEIIAGHRRRFDPIAIPAVCFTEPEIVSVGLAPTQSDGREIVVARFPFLANGRALSMDGAQDGGFIRVVACKSDHRILGIQAVGQHISELAGEFTLALEMGSVLEDIAGTIHAHPTLGEAFHESALCALGHALHL